MPRLTVIGNCVAERLALLLEAIFRTPREGASWEVVRTTPVCLLDASGLERLAENAARCDAVFSQPLFSFGPCATSELRPRLGDRLHLFSAPNFEAYFPDVMDIRPLAEPEKFPSPLEWHSKILVRCKAAGIPPEDVEGVYLNHPLFSRANVEAAIKKSFATYEKRDANVEIGTLELVRQLYDKEPLFHTWNHPGDSIMKVIATGMLRALGFGPGETLKMIQHLPWQDSLEAGTHSYWGFGFNAWPVINRHGLFSFNRPWFRVGGRNVDIMSCAIAYYEYYEAHPAIFAQALKACSH